MLAAAFAGLASVIAANALGGAANGARSAVGKPPPEWATNAASWPAANYDLANARATTKTPIDSKTVSRLRVRWRFSLTASSAFGSFASAPIVVNRTVYLQDLDSDVYALDRATGKPKWRHRFNRPDLGPNGVAYGWGRLYGATDTYAFALDPKTGKLLWRSNTLTRNPEEGMDIVPQLYDHTVLVSTTPGNLAAGPYNGGALGVVWALDAATGKPKWRFNTIAGGAKLWGNPQVNSGGGLWYPPAVDPKGRVFVSVGNPGPLYGTAAFPNGSSRPGPDLYTDSLVALNGQTGSVLWYQQAVAHDIRDYDLMLPPIITTLPIHGAQTEVVLVAGKMGNAYAYRADTGKRIWTLAVGKHRHDTGPLPNTPVTIYPGDFGGVETPMALADNRLFVPWVDLPARASASGVVSGFGTGSGFDSGRGGLTAANATTGKLLWQRQLPAEDFGAATVANDVVLTSTYTGTVYAFDTTTGKLLWTTHTPAGINAFPAIDGDTLLIAAGSPTGKARPQLIAYALS